MNPISHYSRVDAWALSDPWRRLALGVVTLAVLGVAHGDRNVAVPLAAPTAPAPAAAVQRPLPTWLSTPRMRDVTWPRREDFAAMRAALPNPWTIVPIDLNGTPHTVMAHRDVDGFVLDEAVEGFCPVAPCPWPSGLTPRRPLVVSPPLPAHLLDFIAYARTLAQFEGPLRIEVPNAQAVPPPRLPLWNREGDPPAALGDHLERLRSYYPSGGCSMDRLPQQIAFLRAHAAVLRRRTGFAVQGWLQSVGYWSSQRSVHSSYGQSHPTGHAEVLRRVGVDPTRFFLGAVLALPEHLPLLGLGDARRVHRDFGPAFVQELRALVVNPDIDVSNLARLFVIVAGDAPTQDPLYTQLPEAARALVDGWLH